MTTTMRFQIMVCASILIQSIAFGEEAWEVTAKVWDAMDSRNWGQVETLSNKAARTWGANAKKQNDGLNAYPKGDAAKNYANLNELATMTFLKGEALRQKGDIDGAMAAYYTLLADYEYGQCWDKKGWWWQPATAASKNCLQAVKQKSPCKQSRLKNRFDYQERKESVLRCVIPAKRKTVRGSRICPKFSLATAIGTIHGPLRELTYSRKKSNSFQ